MDVTGQAFEDMQEQNIRLMQQLREKDDANFKLMSERIKSNQIHKLLKEEKEELADQLLTLKTQVSHRDYWATTTNILHEKQNQLLQNYCIRLAEKAAVVVEFFADFVLALMLLLSFLGRCPAAGGEEAWGKRTPPAGHH